MSHEALVLTELPDGRELFRLNFKARPKARHPLFERSACGILSIWLFAESAADAVICAKPLIAPWPFEIIGDEVDVLSDLRPPDDPHAVLYEQAEIVGFSAYYHEYDRDADERALQFPGEAKPA